MKSFVFLGGEFVPDVGYDRGPMILYPKEEWRRRSDLQRRHHIRFHILVIAISMSLPMLIVASLVLLPWTRTDPFVIGLLIVGLGMVGGLIVFSRSIIRNFDRGPLMGLYDRGYQFDYEEFYPYEEMERVDTREKGLQIYCGDTRRWVSERRVKTVLGEDGVKEIMRKIDAQSSPK